MDPSTKSAFLRKTRIFAVRDTFFRRVAEKGPAQGRLGAARARDPKIPKKSRKNMLVDVDGPRSVRSGTREKITPATRPPGSGPGGLPHPSQGETGSISCTLGDFRVFSHSRESVPALVRPQPNASKSARESRAWEGPDFQKWAARDLDGNAPFRPPEVSLGREENILDGIFPFA